MATMDRNSDDFFILITNLKSDRWLVLDIWIGNNFNFLNHFIVNIIWILY
jgi:hypothetical protein